MAASSVDGVGVEGHVVDVEADGAKVFVAKYTLKFEVEIKQTRQTSLIWKVTCYTGLVTK